VLHRRWPVAALPVVGAAAAALQARHSIPTPVAGADATIGTVLVAVAVAVAVFLTTVRSRRCPTCRLPAGTAVAVGGTEVLIARADGIGSPSSWTSSWCNLPPDRDPLPGSCDGRPMAAVFRTIQRSSGRFAGAGGGTGRVSSCQAEPTAVAAIPFLEERGRASEPEPPVGRREVAQKLSGMS
jgi:hypothetical protein